jgi:ABC-type transport system substrate-binding protein
VCPRERLGWAARSAAVLALLGCSKELPPPIPTVNAPEPLRGGMVTAATFADTRSIDPANVSDGIAPQIDQALYAGLVDYDAESKIVPELAERWVIEDDGLTFRFTLREGVRFHDGEELTADDVVRSVERALHPSAPNPYSSYFSSIAGYTAITKKKAEHLSGVTAEGKYVVVFRLEKPDATFLPLLAMHMLRPVCRSAGTRYSDTWHPCGAGPFKLLPGGWEHGRQITLVRHEGYFRPGLPHVDAARWLFHVNQSNQYFKFVRGDLDVIRDFLMPDLLRFQRDPRWTPFAEFETEKQISGEAMNCEMPPFDNIEVRRAVAAALDRDELRLVRAGSLRPADQPVPPRAMGHDPNIGGQKYDYAAALEHMKKAGYAYDPATRTGGYPGTIPYIAYKQGLSEYMSQVVAQQLAKIGLRLDVRIVNYPTFMALRGRRRETAMGPGFWQQDYPEAASFLDPLFHTKSIADEDSNNWSFYSNPRLDELVDRSKREMDDAKRKALYIEAERIVIDEAPWAFTYYFRWYVQHQPYLRNYSVHPLWNHDVTRAWLDRANPPHAARKVLGPILGDAR